MGKPTNNGLFYNSGIAPCPKDCEFRQPKCQAYCRVYKLAIKERNERNEKIRKEKDRLNILNAHVKPVRKR